MQLLIYTSYSILYTLLSPKPKLSALLTHALLNSRSFFFQIVRVPSPSPWFVSPAVTQTPTLSQVATAKNVKSPKNSEHCRKRGTTTSGSTTSNHPPQPSVIKNKWTSQYNLNNLPKQGREKEEARIIRSIAADSPGKSLRQSYN